MVRVKDKKAKGDDAFTKRKQKVGRKKLAPATATRAEVHARTLRITGSSSMMAASKADAAKAAPTATPGDAPRHTTAVVFHSFSELLSTLYHYKASQRASAFAALTRLLNTQAKMDVEGSVTRLATSSAESRGAGIHGVSPLQKLHGFSAALEALTDTDDDVRKNALGALRLIIACPTGWIATTGHSTDSSITRTSAVDASLESSDGASTVVEAEHLQAIVQAVHVGLTHALKAVRLSAVELLSVVLEAGVRPAAFRQAARAICEYQRVYFTISTGDDAKTAPADVEDKEQEAEAWMMALVKRVSSLVLRSEKLVKVLPQLLDVVLKEYSGDSDEGADTRMDAEMVLPAANLYSLGSPRAATAWRYPSLVHDFLEEMLPSWSNLWKELMELQLGLLRQDEKLASAVSIARSYSSVLLFLKQRNLQAVAQSSTGPRQRNLNEEGDGPTEKSNIAFSSVFISRNKQQLIKHLFISKIPVTMDELLSSNGTNGGRRLDLGLAIAKVCAPMAGTDEGWKLLHQFFSGVFAQKQGDGSQSPNTSTSPLLASSLSFGTALRCTLASVELYVSILQLFPRIRTEPSVSSVGSSATAAGSVSERLIPFAPALLHTVVQVLYRSPMQRSKEAVQQSVSEESMLARLLLYVVEVVSRLSMYPLTDIRQKGYDGAKKMEQVLRASLGQVFASIPRLMFALRLKERTADVGQSSSEPHGAENCGVLSNHNASVDLAVQGLLRVLWFMSSTSHPLLRHTPEDATTVGPNLRTTLLRSLAALFLPAGHGGATEDGMLVNRCHESTLLLAEHCLFYLTQ